MTKLTKRLLIKGISWRIVSTTQSFWITYVMTGSLENTLKLILIFNITGFVLYYIHETFWDKLKK